MKKRSKPSNRNGRKSDDQNKKFYGGFARFGLFFGRLFSHRYSCRLPRYDGPAVYVCRHLDMHGPYTTLKWLPFDVHPMVLSVYFDCKSSRRHMTEYTFSRREGREPKKFDLKAAVAGTVSCLMIRSLKGVPAYRNSAKALITFRTAMRFLLQGEDIIVFPDIDYTSDYNERADIYRGFIYLGELYHKRTGASLQFIPLLIDDDKREITAARSVSADDYHRDSENAAQGIICGINKAS